MAILDILGDGSCKVCIPLAGDWFELSGNYSVTNPISVTWGTESSSVPFTDYVSANESSTTKTTVTGVGSDLFAGDDDWAETVWIRAKNPPGSSTVTEYGVQRYSGGKTTGMGIMESGEVGYLFGIAEYSGVSVIKSYNFSDGWKHLAWAKDGANYRLYVDGVYIGIDARSDNLNSPNGTDTQFFRGNDSFDMALYRAFNRPLTVSEINTVMNEEEPPPTFIDKHGIIVASSSTFDDVHSITISSYSTFDDVHGIITPSAELFADVHGLDYANAVRRFYDIHSVEMNYEGKIIVRGTS